MKSSKLQNSFSKTDTWPEAFGFTIYGKGPTHIIKVVPGSVAAQSGLKAGDQILQVNSHDVSGWGDDDIISHVSKLSQHPPSLGVVSRIREVTLQPSPISNEFGFSLIGTFPVKIHQIKSESPSDEANLIRNDLVIKIDGDLITSLFQARRLADNAVRNSGIKLSIIPAPSAAPSRAISQTEMPATNRVKEFVKRFEAPRTGQVKAQTFIEKIKEYFHERPAVIEGIVRSIKQYSEDRNLEPFVFTLTAILDPPEEKKVLEELRIFIPRQHKSVYDTLVKKALNQKNSKVKLSRLENFSRDSPLPPIGKRHAVVQHDAGQNDFVATVRQVQVVRRHMSFGITLRGENPVQVQDVDKGSPAEKAGLQKGDELLSLNGLDITHVPHERAIALLQGSGSMPTLVIQTTSGALAPPGTSLHQMPCHASPAIDPQIFTTLENMPLSTKPTVTSQVTNDERDQNNNNNSDTKGTSPMKVTKLNATWTHNYVSPDFKIHGENFDQHLHNLLMPSERRIVKRAMETYDTNKNMDNLLLSINSVLDNPHKWPVWYFVVQSLKGKDRGTCRRKLAELLQSQTSDTSHISKQDFSGGTSTNEGMSCQDNSKETANTRSKIRRRRTMRASYNRKQCDDMNERSVVDSNKIEPATSPSPDRDIFRVRRPRRRRTVSGIDLSKSYESTHNPSDILRIEEPDEIETPLPADVDTEPVFSQNENTVGTGFHTTGRSLRRRRRDPMLRRLQSAESVHAQEISMERDALTARNSMPFVTTPEEQHTGSLRARRRRSFRRSLDGTNTLSTKDPIGCHERAALIVRRRSEQAWTEKPQETHIDSYIRPGSTQSEETTRSRRRRTAANHQYSNRTVVPETSIDDYILSENGNNNNANSLYIDEDSLEQTTDEQEQEDSDMSLKSPLSMKGLRASFRIKSSKNKDLTELKVADTSHGSLNDEKSKSKKSGKPGLLERMGMGKKHQSSSDSSNKDESKSKKLFGKKSSKKDSSSEAKSSKSSKSTNNNSKSAEPVATKAHQKDILNITQTPSPTINDSFFMGNDSPVLENGFFGRNSKKRLTFSRPPKNSDTEAFLTELSAQFDDDLNILDDLAKALQQQADASAHPNFGSKWTYLPGLGERGGKEILQSSNTNDMSDLNLSDIEDNKKDETPPFPLILDSGDESGLGTMDAITPPPQPHYAYRDRELEWERERQNRKKKRRQAFESLTSQSDDRVKTTPSAQNNSISQSQPAVNVYQDDEKIYDIPKTTTATTTTTKTRTRGNRRARRGAMANRSESVPAETSYPPNTRFTRRHAGMELDNVQTSQRNVSEEYIAMLQAAEQNSQNQLDKEKDDVFEKPKRRAFRNPDSVFSASDESVHSENDTVDAPFPVDRKDSQSSSDFAGEVGQKTSNSANGPGDNYVYVDDENVYAAPRSANSTAVRLRKRSHEYPPHSILNGDLSFTDINSLLQESDDEDQPQATLFPNANGIPPPPPPPPGVPPPPPPPPNPSMVGYQQGPASPTRMNVKRLNWQKIEPPDLKETVWGQIGEDYDTINDVVKYLDLEQHFATKKARELKRLSLPVKSSAVSILTHKKAYNTSILLAHLRMTVSQLRGVLLSNNDQRMDTSQYKQMLMYAPDDDEATKLLVYHGDVTKLNEADQFARKMVTIPGYRLRLQALMYKQGFEDREKDVRINLEHIQQASIELRKSKKLAKILEFVLAMGNYMNRGHTRISKATGFKIQFLADMDSTKTSDNKLTFLHILARAVYSKFPELCNFSQDLKDVRPASRVVYPIVFQELQDMRSEWVEIRDRMPEALTKQVRGDRFKQAMENFLVMSNGALKSLEMLLAATMKEFHKTARYFGENAKNVSMQQFFSIFGEFIAKFEKADHEIKLIMQNKSTEITS